MKLIAALIFLGVMGLFAYYPGLEGLIVPVIFVVGFFLFQPWKDNYLE